VIKIPQDKPDNQRILVDQRARGIKREDKVNTPLLNTDKKYTVADYRTWDDDFRCELIDGVVYAMTSPLPIHQIITGSLYRVISNFLYGKHCIPFIAPSDVELDDSTTVQPDIFVICDHTKITRKGIVGAPEFVIEILSPATASKDKVYKYNKYLDAGVLEYWLVDPIAKTIDVFILNQLRYDHNVYGVEHTVPCKIVEGLEIKLSDIFDLKGIAHILENED
jgi:Uma2 family endonuclease